MQAEEHGDHKRHHQHTNHRHQTAGQSREPEPPVCTPQMLSRRPAG